MKDWQSQAHVKWECKYHVVILPKYRRKTLYGKIRRDVRKILRQHSRRKEVRLIEGKVMPNHVHILLSVPPKYSIAMAIGEEQECDSDSSRTGAYAGDVVWGDILGPRVLCEYCWSGRRGDSSGIYGRKSNSNVI